MKSTLKTKITIALSISAMIALSLYVGLDVQGIIASAFDFGPFW